MTATGMSDVTDPTLGRIGFTRVGRLPTEMVERLDRAETADAKELSGLLAPLLGPLASTHEPVSVRRIEVEPGSAQPFRCTPTIVRPGAGDVFELIVATSPATGHAGQLRLRPPFVRAVRPVGVTNDAGARARRAVPLQVGEGLLLREGVGWSTYPNHSEQTTSFVVVTLVERGARLTLVRRCEDGQLEAIDSLRPDELAHHLDTGIVPDGSWQPLRRLKIGLRPRLEGVRAVATDAASVAASSTVRGVRDPSALMSGAVASVRESAPLRSLETLARTGRVSHQLARSAGAPSHGAVVEALLTVADGLGGAAGAAMVPHWVERLHAQRSVWAGEFGVAARELDLPPATYLLGIDDDASSGDRRLVLAHEGRWLDRGVERAPWTSDALRAVRGLVGASFVQLAETGPLTPDPDGRGGSTMVLVPVDAEHAGPLVFDRRSMPQNLQHGTYLLVEVAARDGGPARRVAGWIQRLRRWRPGADSVEHRIMEWEHRGLAEKEAPEGVLVEHYEDFGGGSRSIWMLRTAAGRSAAVDAVSVRPIMGLVRFNNWLVSHHLRGTPAMWDPSRFPWVPRVEAAWDDIQDEVVALMRSGQWVPTVREVVGLESEPDRPAVGSTHEWRNFILYHRGQWMDWNCEQCPRTTEVVRGIPELNFAFFSILEPGGHIARHRGPNGGALRHHVGILIPDPPGSCVIEINGVERHWEEGKTLMFDLTSEHEVWNRSAAPRVLLMCEVNTPLPPGLRAVNRLTQAAYSAMPPFRRMKAHLTSVERPARPMAR